MKTQAHICAIAFLCRFVLRSCFFCLSFFSRAKIFFRVRKLLMLFRHAIYPWITTVIQGYIASIEGMGVIVGQADVNLVAVAVRRTPCTPCTPCTPYTPCLGSADGLQILRGHPFNPGYFLLMYSGNPGVNVVSHREGCR